MGTVLELLSDPKRWHKGAHAAYVDPVTGAKRACKFNDERAVCWCVLGAACKVYSGTSTNGIVEKIRATPTFKASKFVSIAEFNDKVDHKTMIQMVREAGI